MRPFGIQRIRLFIFCTIFHTDIWRWRISTIKSIGSLILRICQRALKSADPRAIFLLLMIWVYTASVTVVQIRSRSSTLVYQRTAFHTTSSPMTRSSSPAWTAPTPRWPSTSSLTAPPQFASGSCRTASNSTLTSQRWYFSAPCSAPVSCQHHHRRRCRKHSAGRIEAQSLGVTIDSNLRFDCHARNVAKACNFHTRALRHVRSLLTALALCATCAVYWLTTSPRQSRAASSLPGWTIAMRCWVAHRRRLSTSYSAPRTTWPESSPRAGVASTPGRCFTRYIGFRWGSGSRINWLFWLTRCGPQPFQRISASWNDPCTTSGSALFRCPDTRRSSHTHRTGPSRFFLLLLHPLTYLLTYLLTFYLLTWNSLPADIRLCENILTFKRHLKTHLFKLT